MNAVSSTSPAFRPSQQDYQQNEIDARQQEAVKEKEHKPSWSISRSASGSTDEQKGYSSIVDKIPTVEITY